MCVFQYILLLTLSSNLCLNNNNLPQINKQNCIKKIVESLFKNETHLLYLTKRADVDGIPEDIPRTIVTNDVIYQYLRMDYQFVIYLNYETAIKDFILKLRQTLFWKPRFDPRRKYLFVLDGPENITSAFVFLKSVFIVNVVIIHINLVNDSFTMYQLIDICHDDGYIKQDYKCGEGELIKFPKLQRRLNGCLLRVVALPFMLQPNYAAYTNKTIGLTIRPLLLLPKLFHVKLQIITPSVKKQQWYGAVVGMAKKIEDGDVIASAPFRGMEVMRYFEFSNYMYFENYVWILQRPKRLLEADITSYLFTLPVWILVIFGLVMTVGVCKIILKSHSDYNKITLMHILQLFLGSSLKHFPKIDLQRFFLCYYIIYCFLMSVFIQTRLSSVMTLPFYEKSVTNIYELSASKLIPAMSNRTYFLYAKLKQSHATIISNKTLILYEHKQNVTDAELVIGNSKLAILSRALKSKHSDFARLNHFVDPFMFKFLMSYTYENGSYFQSYLNEIIYIFRENGFDIKAIDEITYDEVPDLSEDKYVVSLSWHHLNFIYRIWFVGVGIGFIIFIFEIFYAHYKLRKHRSRKTSDISNSN